MEQTWPLLLLQTRLQVVWGSSNGEMLAWEAIWNVHSSSFTSSFLPRIISEVTCSLLVISQLCCKVFFLVSTHLSSLNSNYTYQC